MNAKRWLPIALCCVPGVVFTTVVGIGFIVGGVTFLNSPLSAALLILALLACPLSMGLLMLRMNRQARSVHWRQTADCCVSAKVTAAREAGSPVGDAARGIPEYKLEELVE